MNFKSIFAAVAVFLAPLSANALTTMVDGGTYNLATDNVFIYEEVITEADASRTFTLYVDPYQALALGTVDLVYFPVGTTSGMTVTFGGDAVTVTDDGAKFAASINSLFDGPGLANAKDLVISWTGAKPGAGEQLTVRVSAVPLPAGFLLLGTALIGAGMVRRRAA